MSDRADRLAEGIVFAAGVAAGMAYGTWQGSYVGAVFAFIGGTAYHVVRYWWSGR